MWFLAIFLRALQSLRLVWRLLLDPRVSVWLKLVPLVVLMYIAWPRDLIPDRIPVVGWMDDLLVTWLGLRFFLSFAPRNVAKEHQEVVKGDVIEGKYRIKGDKK